MRILLQISSCGSIVIIVTIVIITMIKILMILLQISFCGSNPPRSPLPSMKGKHNNHHHKYSHHQSCHRFTALGHFSTRPDLSLRSVTFFRSEQIITLIKIATTAIVTTSLVNSFILLYSRIDGGAMFLHQILIISTICNYRNVIIDPIVMIGISHNHWFHCHFHIVYELLFL